VVGPVVPAALYRVGEIEIDTAAIVFTGVVAAVTLRTPRRHRPSQPQRPSSATTRPSYPYDCWPFFRFY